MNCPNASVLSVEEPLSHTSPCVVAQNISYNYRVCLLFFFSCSPSPSSTQLSYHVWLTRVLSHSGPIINTHKHTQTHALFYCTAHF